MISKELYLLFLFQVLSWTETCELRTQDRQEHIHLLLQHLLLDQTLPWDQWS